MFSHLIYYRRGHEPMYSWDPAVDFLVEPDAYLLWRHVRQLVAYDALPYGGVIVDRQHLSVVRFSHDLYFDDVEAWMKQSRRPGENKRLGFRQRSRYHSILRPLFFKEQEKELDERLKLINEFFEEHHPVEGGHVPWRRGQIGGEGLIDEWIAIKRCFVDSCLRVIPSAG